MLNSYQSNSVKIKESSGLFEDFLYDFDKVIQFFDWDYRNKSRECFTTRLHKYENRNSIQPVILDQNISWEASPKTLENIKLLAETKTVTIVTGQQAGLLGGPLYTTYKVLTTIRLAEHFARLYPDLNFVPCFWMEVGDNDYQEINHFFLYDNSFELKKLSLPEQSDDYRSIYLRNIPLEMSNIYQQLADLCPETEFKEKYLQKYQTIYHSSTSFSDAFARWLLEFFSKYGLIVFNPEDSRIKSISKNLFRKALENRPKINELFARTSEVIEKAGYHTQIKLNEGQTLLFFQTDDFSRARLDASNGFYLVKHPKKTIEVSAEEIFMLLDSSPERFSANVALRPVLQDFLLPTGLYVGGPAEITYAAQLKDLYETLEIVQPIFYPRIRLTLIEKNIDRLIKKFGFDYDILFDQKNQLTEQYLKSYTDKILLTEFEIFENQMAQAFDRLSPVLQNIDASLQSALKKSADQIDSTLKKLRLRSDAAFARKMEIEVGQLNKIIHHFFPEGSLQERKINLLYYLVKYGPEFLDNLKSAVYPDHFSHQLVFI